METAEEKISSATAYACTGCGADLKYKPGSTHLACDHCGANNEIPTLGEKIVELDLYEYLKSSSAKEEMLTVHVVNCNGCGATSSLEKNTESGKCPYCDNPIVVNEAHDEQVLRPKALIPFKLNSNEAKAKFKSWLNSLWFAPNTLKKAIVNTDHFKGIYLPYWTFDSATESGYVGQRGEYYYVSESVSVIQNGKSVMKQQQVRKTRWHNVSGSLAEKFDDVLVAATRSLPRDYLNKLEPWDLHNVVAFDHKYLSGYITEKYKVGLDEGFDIAKERIDERIVELIKIKIGGDTQRVISVNTEYNDITFKHILLPVYVSAYRFKGKLYQFLVNGRTGEVQGERPWSWTKIAVLVLLIIGAIGLLVYLKHN